MNMTKKLTLLAMGIALFVALSMCLQVPVFENYYLCLGYVVMAVYCYSFGSFSGTIVGFFGVLLYCTVISGFRGMPGWALGNIVIGVFIGLAFRKTKEMSSVPVRTALQILVILAATALGILGVKSITESLLYGQPFLLRVAKNSYAFIADSVVLCLSIPLCAALDPIAQKHRIRT